MPAREAVIVEETSSPSVMIAAPPTAGMSPQLMTASSTYTYSSRVRILPSPRSAETVTVALPPAGPKLTLLSCPPVPERVAVGAAALPSARVQL